MSLAQIVVTAVGVGAVAWELWFFLWARRPGVAASKGGTVQQIRVTVKGGYTPDTIVVQAGRPVALEFYRDETSDCSERVVFPDFGVDARLPAFETTKIEFTPTTAGEYPFRCGMNMLKGLLVVEPASSDRQPAASPHKLHQK